MNIKDIVLIIYLSGFGLVWVFVWFLVLYWKVKDDPVYLSLEAFDFYGSVAAVSFLWPFVLSGFLIYWNFKQLAHFQDLLAFKIKIYIQNKNNYTLDESKGYRNLPEIKK